MTIYVNLFGQPSAGKSSVAFGVASDLKHRGINCELVTEYAKDLVWASKGKPHPNMDIELYMVAKKFKKLYALNGQVDVVVTDAPLMMSKYYVKDWEKGLLLPTLGGYTSLMNNFNVFIKRTKDYNPKGRHQTAEEAEEISRQIQRDTNFNLEVTGNPEGQDMLVDTLINLVGE